MDYRDFAASLAMAQAGYDDATPSEPATIEHWACEGTGKAGCTRYCNNSEAEKELCRREHTCFMCAGTGRIPYSKRDAQDDKANER